MVGLRNCSKKKNECERKSSLHLSGSRSGSWHNHRAIGEGSKSRQLQFMFQWSQFSPMFAHSHPRDWESHGLLDQLWTLAYQLEGLLGAGNEKLAPTLSISSRWLDWLDRLRAW